MGYHTLHVSVGDRTQDATLISAPERIPMLPAMEHDQLWGWMAQLYSIRSAGSWGVGDFEDLKTLMVDSHSKTGADFMLVNPLHACEPVAPLTPSPYLPISRRFINFTYIRPEAIEEYAGLGDDLKSQIGELHAQAEPLNGDAQIIDRDSMWRVKMHALWLIFKAGRSEERQKAFDDYKSTSAEGLEAYATWCLCYDKWGARPAKRQLGEAPRQEQRRGTGAASTVPRHIGLLPLVGMDRRRAAGSRSAGREGRRHADRPHGRHGGRRASVRLRRVVEPGVFRQGRHGRRAAGLLQPAGAGLEPAATQPDRAGKHRLPHVSSHGAGHVRPCRRGAHRPHPRPVPPVVDPLRAHAQGRRLCAVRFRDHARHPGT